MLFTASEADVRQNNVKTTQHQQKPCGSFIQQLGESHVCDSFLCLNLRTPSKGRCLSLSPCCQHPNRFEFLLLFLHVNSILIYLFIYLWLCWVFVAVRGLSLVAASGGYSSLRCAGFPLRWFLLLQSTGSRRAGFSSFGSRAQ